MEKLFLDSPLTLFGEGGDGGTTAAGAAPSEGAGNQGDQNQGVSTRRSKGEYANVMFGKQDAAEGQTDAKEATAGQTDGKTSTDDDRKAYEELIKGKYKDFFTQDTQRIINQRFKETKQQEATLKKQGEVLQTLMDRYKVTDIDSLSSAIESDDTMWEDAADEAGMTVKQYKELQKLKRQNAEYQQMQMQEETDRRAQETLAQWYAEADALKKTFPSFDLDMECQNPAFVNMLKHGLSVEHAYKTIHLDEIVTEAMKTTAKAAEKRVVDNVRAKGTRPLENGVNGNATFTIKDDVHQLTRADRAEIARRAARGERIQF